MNVEQKIEQARAKQNEEKRDNKGKYRKLTIVERCGKWTISWVIFWSILAGSSWTYNVNHIGGLIQPVTIIVENVHAQEDIDAQVEHNTPQIEESEAIMGEFTAYNAEVGQTDDEPEIMASTKKVYAGAIACPIKYEFGTKIKVAGKIYTCEDRMAKKYRDGEYFDIYMESGEEAGNWGRRNLTYEVIK